MCPPFCACRKSHPWRFLLLHCFLASYVVGFKTCTILSIAAAGLHGCVRVFHASLPTYSRGLVERYYYLPQFHQVRRSISTPPQRACAVIANNGYRAVILVFNTSCLRSCCMSSHPFQQWLFSLSRSSHVHSCIVLCTYSVSIYGPCRLCVTPIRVGGRTSPVRGFSSGNLLSLFGADRTSPFFTPCLNGIKQMF